MYKTIVVGTDGSPTADLAVAEALRIAGSSGAVVHFVHGYRPLKAAEMAARRRGLPARQADEVDDAHDARVLLDRMAKLAADAGVTAEFHAREGAPGTAIVAVAREAGADVIVVGNVGLRGLRGYLGNVPSDVAHHAPCAVLIVRTTA